MKRSTFFVLMTTLLFIVTPYTCKPVFGGAIISWGLDNYGQATPPAGTNFVAIAAGSYYSLALKSDGSIIGWGWNNYGQATPPAGTDFVAIATTNYHSLALKSDGSIVGWGRNDYGQATPPAGNDFVAIAAGYYHSLALKSDGSIVGWGYNNYGQAAPPAGTDFVAIAASGYHGLALKSNGSIVGWGYNYYGQAAPPTGIDFVAIAAGSYYSLALKSNGSIVGWGDNGYGQTTPPAETDFVAITTGDEYCLSLKSDGSIVGWGYNSYGQATPPAGSDFVAIAAGYGHSLAIEGGPPPPEPILQWQKTFGGSSDEKGHSVQQTSDGGYVIAGYTGSYGAGNLDVYLIKTDSSGNLQWQKTFGSTAQEQGWAVLQTPDGGYIIGGGSDLIKTDSQGNLQWQKQLNGYCYAMQQTSDGGYVITGYSAGNVCLIKTTSAGNVQWTGSFGGSKVDEGWSVQQTSDGGYIIAGHTYSYSSGQDDVYLIKTDVDGNLQWQNNFGGSSWDVGRSVRQTPDGGYIIAGYTYSYGAGNGDVWLIKTDSAGNMQWQKTFGGNSYDNGYCLQVTSDGGYILTGFTQSYGAGNWDVWVIKTDSSGNLEWQKPIGGTNQEEGWSVQQTSDYGYIIAGATQSYGAGGRDVYLIKLQSTQPPPQTVTIHGTVRDAASGNLLDGVTITAGGQETLTDYIGNYEITGLSAGNITVTASKEGYEDQSILQPAAEAGETYTIDFELRPIIELVGLEVIQTIQDWNNSVPLIADKKTWVRAHVKTKGLPYVRIPKAFLHAYKADGSELKRIVNKNPDFLALPSINRDVLNESIYFKLPSDWYKAGTLNLQLSLFNCALDCQETASTDDNCSLTVEFLPTAQPRITLIGVETMNYPALTGEGLKQSIPSLVAIYPVNDIDYEIGAKLDLRLIALLSKDPSLMALSTVYPEGLMNIPLINYVNSLLSLIWIHNAASTGDWDSLYYGVILNAKQGQAAIGGVPPVASGDYSTIAHELGHCLSRPHTAKAWAWKGPCGAWVIPGPNEFPHIYNILGNERAAIGPISDPIYGLDTSESPPEVKSSWEYFELMSYCFPRWISNYTYEKIRVEINNRFGGSAAAMAMTEAGSIPDYLIVRGSINLDDYIVQFVPYSFITNPVSSPPSPEPGDYTLETFDGNGVPVSAVAFQPSEYADLPADYPRTGSFIIPVPADPNIKQVSIYHNWTLIATQTASDNSPTVQVISPNGGEVFDDSLVTIQWSGSDADGDILTYVLQYSSDSGATWETLAVDWPDTSYEIERQYLTATNNGLIRVTASDGFNTGFDESDGVFSVSNNAPYVFITSPVKNSIHTGEQLIFFEAMAYDKEDGQLADMNIQWSSSIDGALGSGKNLTKDANSLSEGKHVITVTATDSEGLADTDTVSIWVFREPPDNIQPVADAGEDQTVYAGIDGTIDVDLDGSDSNDIDGDSLTYSWSLDGQQIATGVQPTVTLPTGMHTIELVVSDGVFDSVPDEVVITVLDNIPPEFALSVTPDVLWPPNHKMVQITPSWTVSDNCDDSPQVMLISITMNEGDETNSYDPSYDDTEGDGNTTDDIQVGSDGSIYLRAERSGKGDGRVYTITYRAVDDSGNATVKSATVTVPHDQS